MLDEDSTPTAQFGGMDNVSSSAVALIAAGHDTDDVRNLASCLVRLGFKKIDFVRLSDAVSDLRRARARHRSNTVVFAFVEECGGVDSVCRHLSLLRGRSPSTRVVLLSREFGGDDFSSTRKRICDVSLKLPSVDETVASALLVATRNNRLWRDWIYGSGILDPRAVTEQVDDAKAG